MRTEAELRQALDDLHWAEDRMPLEPELEDTLTAIAVAIEYVLDENECDDLPTMLVAIRKHRQEKAAAENN